MVQRDIKLLQKTQKLRRDTQLPESDTKKYKWRLTPVGRKQGTLVLSLEKLLHFLTDALTCAVYYCQIDNTYTILYFCSSLGRLCLRKGCLQEDKRLLKKV